MSALALKPDLFNIDSEATLNSFIASTVQPDQAFLDVCGSAVQKVVTLFQHNAPDRLRPCRVIKGGSLGKGTAVKSKSDIDIVVMLAKCADMHDLVDNMSQTLEDMATYLQGCPGVTVINTTHRAVQIRIAGIEADVLPAIDLLEISDYRMRELFKEMGSENSNTQGFYSPCLAPLQKKLFDGIPTKVKSLIRLLKYWKKEKLQKAERAKWPASYALELIVLHCWSNAGKPQSFKMDRALHAVLTSLVQHRNFRVTLPDRMSYRQHDLDFGKIKTPYIMDPCNPFNNVYYKGSYDWTRTARKAEEWLGKSLFVGVTGTSSNWG